MSQQYSNLEVDRHANAPEVFPYYAPYPNATTDKGAYTTDAYAYEQPAPASICAPRRRTFWIVAIIAIIVVLAAVGGGIGGALASRSSHSNSNAQTSATPSIAPQASTTRETSSQPTPTSIESSKTITATRIVGPTSTILRDCPSSNDTLHDVTLGDTTMSFRKACDISAVNSNGIWNAVQGITRTLDECIDLCASYNNMNKTQIRNSSNRICNSVCWRNTFDKINDWEGGHCFGFMSTNSSGTFNFKQPPETRCDTLC